MLLDNVQFFVLMLRRLFIVLEMLVIFFQRIENVFFSLLNEVLILGLCFFIYVFIELSVFRIFYIVGRRFLYRVSEVDFYDCLILMNCLFKCLVFFVRVLVCLDVFLNDFCKFRRCLLDRFCIVVLLKLSFCLYICCWFLFNLFQFLVRYCMIWFVFWVVLNLVLVWVLKVKRVLSVLLVLNLELN